MKKTKKIEFFFEIFRILAAIGIAYLVALVVLVAISDDPVNVVKQFMAGPFATKRRIGNIIELAIPYTFTGLGMCFMYSANRFNLIGEGAFMFSGCIAALFALKLAPMGIPAMIFPILLILIGGVMGAGAASVPALLKEKLGANEVVVSIMMNYILMFLAVYILKTQMRDKTVSFNASEMIPETARLTQFVPGTRIHTGIFIAILMVVISVVVFYKTPLGYSIRTCGMNPHFARYSGIKVGASIVAAQLIGGMLAGIGGSVEILGLYDRFQWDNLTQHGFDGLLVAVLARKNPIFVPIAALLLAYLRTGADVVNRATDIPAEFVSVLQAIIILLIAAQMFLSHFKNKIIFKTAREKLVKEEGAK